MENKQDSFEIAEGLTLPISAVTQTFAQIGRRGAGKTYLSSMIAEKMLDAGAQIIVLDVMGIWWGLRVGEDGKSKGKDIFVIGGAHGDIPLAPEAGRDIAKILAEKNLSVVLDISEFRKNDRKKFVTDFAEEFYHLKKTHASPVHIFLEESQKFVPQQTFKDDARMLGAWEDIVRLGRNYGIGCSLISQRPQSINKEVLSQVECLCVLQITGLHERKALEEWIQEAGEDRKIIGQLPGLHRGEGYVWSPSWLRIFKRVNFHKKTTFDTGATPEVGKETKAVAKLSKIDIERLQKQMASVIEKSQKELKTAEDFKKEITRLNREITLVRKGVPPLEVKVDHHAIEKSRKEGFKDAEIQYSKLVAEIKGVNNELKKRQDFYDRTITKIQSALETLKFPEMQKITTELNIKPTPHESTRVMHETTGVVSKVPEGSRVSKGITENSGEGQSLNLCARKVYSFLYHHPDKEWTKAQIGAFTGYSQKSGGFNNALYRLNAMNLIERSRNIIKVKDMDPNIAGEFDYSKEAILSQLPKCPKEIYQFLLNNPYEEFSKESIAERTGYSAGSGGFNNALYKLNSLELIERNGGSIKLNSNLLEL